MGDLAPPAYREQTYRVDTHGVKRAVQFALPEIQKVMETRELRRQIQFLPDVEQQERVVVG